MLRHSETCDVLVVGGGPAGIAAACCASAGGGRVVIVDDNPGLGGQIWRGDKSKNSSAEAREWFEKFRTLDVVQILGARVIDQPEKGILLAESAEETAELHYQKVILANGARERFLPFPGWTLPNVCGAGGLQALVKSGLPIGGKKVVVAGSGPLLLAVAAYLRERDANVLLVAEQARLGSLIRFATGLWTQPGKIRQAFELRRRIRAVPFLTSCWPIAALGGELVSGVRLRRGRKTWKVGCDYLACGFHLVPNLELAQLMGCATVGGSVQVNELQETSVPEVFCAGESTGIGGLDLSLVEGQIAGHAAVGRIDSARALFEARKKQQRFADILNRTFALRDELKALPDPETIVCRCEDVTLDRMRRYDSWRPAKLQTRCGMGPCQGRICGTAAEFLLGWGMESVRPPVFPARLESLIQRH